jgi:aminopeptidase N
LFLDKGATKDDELWRASVIAHETAHMWFGDLVTMRWFNDVWMKEVFANFMADKATEGAAADSNYDLKFLLDHSPAAYGIDRTAGANPIRKQLDNLQDAGSLYGNIIYHKAPIMMRQLERLVGKETLRKGLQVYLKQYAFGNASWPELISILDRETPVDLAAWNKVWVDEPGRPLFDYSLSVANGVIDRFIIRQKGEDSSSRVWPQSFEIAFVYPDTVQEVSIHMTDREMDVTALHNMKLPKTILFNSSGYGYGLFPVDTVLAASIASLTNPVMRASAYINTYENMLSGRGYKPRDLLNAYRNLFTKEEEELNLRLVTSQMADVYWRLLNSTQRSAVVDALEDELWSAIETAPTPNKKKLLFRAYQSMAGTAKGLDRLYTVWKKEMPPQGVVLTEEDYTSLSFTLAIKEHAETSILHTQLRRIKNPDRQKRFEFLMPSVSKDEAVRDRFFQSLKEEKNREKEAWVITALQYLHHPLRAGSSQKYIRPSLDLLEEIQQTGDIFFPQSWLGSTLGSYQSTYAADVVQQFMKEHPFYNPKLKAKILQAADGLFRAVRTLEH